MEIAIINNAGEIVDSFELSKDVSIDRLCDVINCGLDKSGFVECNYCSLIVPQTDVVETSFSMVKCKACREAK